MFVENSCGSGVRAASALHCICNAHDGLHTVYTVNGVCVVLLRSYMAFMPECTPASTCEVLELSAIYPPPF